MGCNYKEVAHLSHCGMWLHSNHVPHMVPLSNSPSPNTRPVHSHSSLHDSLHSHSLLMFSNHYKPLLAFARRSILLITGK